MSNQQLPKSMIPVEEFAKRKGITKEKVITMIKNGFYVGRVIGEQWFVEPSELIGSNIISKNTSQYLYRSDYIVARMVSKFMSFIGWLVFVGGVIAVFVVMVQDLTSLYNDGVLIFSLLQSFGIAISGLFLVASGQITLATVDNADHSREILNFIKEKS